MRKMEHSRWSRWRDGNDATGRSAEPHSLARTCEGSPVKLCESLVASTGAVDREFFLISELCELSQSSSRLSETDLEALLRRTDALVHLGEVENDFDSFFSPKMRKMEHSRWSRWRDGNDATGRFAEPHSLARTCVLLISEHCELSLKALVGSPEPIWRLYLSELMLWFILGRSKMISTPFLHQKCAKWNTADGADGATETTPPATLRSPTASPGPTEDHLSSSVNLL